MIKNAPGEELTIEDIISKLPEIELQNLDRCLEQVVDDLGDWEEMDEVLEYNLAE